MSFALRWKHENMRSILIVAAFSIAMTFMFMMLLYGTAIKRVTVVVNGQESVVQTRQWELSRLLDEQNIQVGEHDRISVPLTASLKNGDRIVIDHTKPVQLTADGETKTVYTTGQTVESALKDLNISVGELDKVIPAADTALADNAAIQVVRVKKETEDFTETIPYEVVKKNDAQLLKGKEQTVQEGQEGVVLKTKEKVYEDGKLVSEEIVKEEVQSESVNKVVAVGTKNPVIALSASSPNMDEVTKSGVTFGYKQIVKNMTLTAYTASAGGKSANHPQYGLTSTGTRVTEGRTIAVDPKVIPLGWWVYIEGLGFRRAEDIGSAVKGNIIDVYFDSADYATKFGTKRGYTVYIIGPKKPTAD
ncbi:3D domain-containing protein [Paenibacillus hamazuiensis]|uniref:3D domain-containing protein n=1 Tax=Paenibacillus hamazuiensis TaxID=2936508 RepID=UPI00200EBC82|nr:3D domain-containing protein [Paenibacillus hamazuiensis]